MKETTADVAAPAHAPQGPDRWHSQLAMVRTRWVDMPRHRQRTLGVTALVVLGVLLTVSIVASRLQRPAASSESLREVDALLFTSANTAVAEAMRADYDEYQGAAVRTQRFSDGVLQQYIGALEDVYVFLQGRADAPEILEQVGPHAFYTCANSRVQARFGASRAGLWCLCNDQVRAYRQDNDDTDERTARVIETACARGEGVF